jgi:hypothetical protein
VAFLFFKREAFPSLVFIAIICIPHYLSHGLNFD